MKYYSILLIIIFLSLIVFVYYYFFLSIRSPSLNSLRTVGDSNQYVQYRACGLVSRAASYSKANGYCHLCQSVCC